MNLGNFIKARIRRQSSLCFAEIKLQPSPIAAKLIGELYLVKFKLKLEFLAEERRSSCLLLELET